MPVQNIFAARPVRSIADYENELAQRDHNQLAMQSQQMNMLAQRQTMADEVATRDAFTAAKGDPTRYGENLAAAGQYKAYQAHLKSQADLAKAAQDAAKVKSETQGHDLKNQAARLDLASREFASANPNDDMSMVRAYDRVVQSGFFGDNKDEAIARAGAELKAMPPKGTPERLDWYAKQLRMGLDMKSQLEQQHKDETLKETGRHNVSTETETARNHRTTEGTAAGQLGVARGQLGVSQARLKLAQAGSEPGASPNTLGDEDVAFMAKQYLRGDQSVMTNIGRGAQGANNIVRLRKAIREQAEAAGMAPEHVALATAQFQGDKAAFRTAGTKGANIEMAAAEAGEVATLALDASKKFDRTRFAPVNKAIRAYESNSGDPDVVAFGAANLALINTYARAISPSGVPTVNDKQHANEMLNTAQSKEQYEAVVGQMQKEIQAAMKSPGTVRANMGSRMTAKPGATPAHAQPGKVVDFGELK